MKTYTYNGFTGTLAELCEKFSISYSAVTARLSRGWTLERALSTPVNRSIE